MAYEFEKEIMEAGVANVIPSYALISESFYYIQEATEKDFLELAQSIGIKELGVLEATGSELVIEAESEEGEKVKSNILSKIQGAWTRIKEIFDKLLKTIQGKIGEAKKKLSDAVLKKIKERTAYLDADGNKVTYGEFYSYDNLKKSMKMDSGTLVSDSEDEIEYDLEYLRTKKVETNKAYISANFDYIVKCALDFKFTKSSILEPYNEVKKFFNEEIKKAKSNKLDKEEIGKLKANITNLNKIASSIVKAFHERQRLALGILTKLAVATLKNTKKAEAKKAESKKKEAENAAPKEEVKEESAMVETSVVESYTTEINKLFDWNF